MTIAVEMDTAFIGAGKPKRGKWRMSPGAIHALAACFDSFVGAALHGKTAKYHGLRIECDNLIQGWALEERE